MSYAKPHGQALSVTTFSRNGRRRKRGEGNHSEWGDLSESPNLEPPPFLSLSVAVGRARIEGYKPIIIITFSSWLWEDGEREREREEGSLRFWNCSAARPDNGAFKWNMLDNFKWAQYTVGCAIPFFLPLRTNIASSKYYYNPLLYH